MLNFKEIGSELTGKSAKIMRSWFNLTASITCPPKGINPCLALGLIPLVQSVLDNYVICQRTQLIEDKCEAQIIRYMIVFDPFSAGTVFIRQNLTLKTVPALT